MRKFQKYISFLLVVCALLSACPMSFADDVPAEETAAAEPAPAPELVPEQMPEPVQEPVPEPVVTEPTPVVPDPVPEATPAPEIVPEPSADPVPEMTPVPETTTTPEQTDPQNPETSPEPSTIPADSSAEEQYAITGNVVSGDALIDAEKGHAIYGTGLLNTKEVPIEMLPVYNPKWSIYENTNEPGVKLIKTALSEIDKSDSAEQPKGSGLVKYNYWYYGDSYSLYDPTVSWDTIFISWCAEQAGLTEDGCYAKISNAETLYEYMRDVTLCANSYLESIIMGYTEAEGGDLLFLRDENGKIYKAGIITNTDDPETIKVVFGDYNGEVRQVVFTKDSFGEQSPFKMAEVLHVEYKKNSRRVYEFCIKNLNLNKAAAIAIMANISCESAFAPVCTGDNGTSFGLCQWHGERWINLKNFCDSTGYVWYELEGQLAFLQYELNGKGQNVYSKLLRVSDTQDGCFEAAKYFCLYFENPANAEAESNFRADLAANNFWYSY